MSSVWKFENIVNMARSNFFKKEIKKEYEEEVEEIEIKKEFKEEYVFELVSLQSDRFHDDVYMLTEWLADDGYYEIAKVVSIYFFLLTEYDVTVSIEESDITKIEKIFNDMAYNGYSFKYEYRIHKYIDDEVETKTYKNT